MILIVFSIIYSINIELHNFNINKLLKKRHSLGKKYYNKAKIFIKYMNIFIVKNLKKDFFYDYKKSFKVMHKIF